MQPIQGNLPFNNGGGNMLQGLSGTPQQAVQSLGANYQNAYNSALAMNQANYQNILKGYQDTMSSQTSAQDAISRGYTGLYNDVIGKIQGIGDARSQAITDQYAMARGNADQGLINRGLSSSTVRSSVQRGLTFDEAKARTDLANQIAQTNAGYMSQLGLAGLGYQGQAVQNNSALAQNQLNWMNSVNSPYPDAGQYSQLAMQYGMMDQANRDRAAQGDARKQMLGAGARAGTPTPTGTTVSRGSGSGFSGPEANYGSNGGGSVNVPGQRRMTTSYGQDAINQAMNAGLYSGNNVIPSPTMMALAGGTAAVYTAPQPEQSSVAQSVADGANAQASPDGYNLDVSSLLSSYANPWGE